MISEESSLVGTQIEARTHATTFLTHKYLSSKRMQTKVFHDCVSVEEKMWIGDIFPENIAKAKLAWHHNLNTLCGNGQGGQIS